MEKQIKSLAMKPKNKLSIVLLLLSIAAVAALIIFCPRANAQLGSTYNELCRRFGEKGQWQPATNTYLFNRGGTYIITASFGTGKQKYCDLIMYSHADGHDFRQPEIETLASHIYSGVWPICSTTGGIAGWHIEVKGVDVYGMLFINKQEKISDPTFTRTVQSLVFGTPWALRARGYWDPNGQEQE